MSLIDLEYFKKVSLHDPEFALEIIERFLAQAKGYRAELSEAMESDDFWRIKQTFQQLKAQAAVFGATSLVRQIRRLEIAPISKYEEHKESAREAEALFLDLLEEIESVRPVFQQA